MDSHRIASDQLDVAINAHGAELTSIRHHAFGEMLWQAGPIWPQHAPNLFPIVGQLVGDQLRIDGQEYALKRHGFARNRRFEWLERDAGSCRLVLRADAETLASYPFAFALELGYRVTGATLTVSYVVANTGTRTLPASVGAHPAFRWPLAEGRPKEMHTLQFERAEPAPIRRLADGLLKRETFPTPIEGRVLRLADDLFAADALIMDQLASHSVRYSAPDTPAIVVGWEGFRELGIWSKGGGAFVCIEPWYGYASPVDFDGPFPAKPGLLHIPPGEERKLSLSIAILPPGAARG